MFFLRCQKFVVNKNRHVIVAIFCKIVFLKSTKFLCFSAQNRQNRYNFLYIFKISCPNQNRHVIVAMILAVVLAKFLETVI